MDLGELKSQFRYRAGRVLHKMGYQNIRLARKYRDRYFLIKRFWAYLFNFYEVNNEISAKLYLEEADVWCYCDYRDWLVRKYIEGTSKIYEWHYIAHCLEQMRLGDHVIDVGANHGFWGLSLGRVVGSNGCVYFIEANPILADRLKVSMKINPAIKSKLFACALGDGKNKSITFYTPTISNSGTGSTVLHNYAREHGYLSKERQIRVPGYSLDQLYFDKKIKGMDILKIDVEFGEDAVIRGARNILGKYHPRLIICETSAGSEAYNVLTKDYGYDSYIVTENGKREDSISEEYWGNIFFVLK